MPSKKVNRSTYQKVVEENKRLLKDIKTLVAPISAEQLLVKHKWRIKFESEQEYDSLLKQAVSSFIENNPNDEAVIAFKEISNSVKL